MNCKMNHQQDRYDNCDFWFIAAYNEFISIAYADASVHRLNRSTSYREGEREHVVFYWHIKQIAAPTRLMHFVCTQFGIVCDTKAAQINWNNKRYLSYRGYTPLPFPTCCTHAIWLKSQRFLLFPSVVSRGFQAYSEWVHRLCIYQFVGSSSLSLSYLHVLDVCIFVSVCVCFCFITFI